MALTRKERIGLMAARRAALDVKAAQTDLDGKAPAVHGHLISDVSGLQGALDGKQPSGSYVLTVNYSWDALPGKPTTFPPSAHAHVIADVTGLQAALDAKLATANFTWNNLSGKPTAFTPSAHSHVIADVTGLQVALDGKQPTGAYLTGITGTQVTTALGFTPYNATNPSGYISGITSGMVSTALGFTPYNSTNPSGFISGITSGMVATALGYTPASRAGDTFTGLVTVQSTGLNAAIRLLNTTGGRDFRIMQKDAGYLAITDETAGAERLGILSGGGVYANVDLRAPLLYDLNNTAYYVDPAGISRISSTYISNGNAYLYSSAAHSFDVRTGAAGSEKYFRFDPAGYFLVTGGDVRATMFYDQDNTAFYVNPNGTSTLYALTMTGGLLIGRTGTGTDVNAMNDTGSFSVRGDVNNAAVMSFHRAGAYAINMGLGTDNVVRIGGWSASSNCFQMDGSGNLTMLGNVTAYSDARLKKDVETISGALDMVSAMRGVRYTRIDSGQRQVGVIAQEMQEVVPEVVQNGIGDDDTLSVAYGNLVGILIEAIKELRNEVHSLKGN